MGEKTGPEPRIQTVERIVRASPYPTRYPWEGDPVRGGSLGGTGHAGRQELRLALALGRPIDLTAEQRTPLSSS